jgi:flagellar biosynthesis protein FlhA
VHARRGLLQVLTIDPLVEQQLVEAIRPGEMGAGLALLPGTVEHLVDSATSKLRTAEDLGHSPVLVCAAPLRAPLSRLMRTSAPRLAVLSYAEIDPTLRIETLGVIAHVDALVA